MDDSRFDQLAAHFGEASSRRVGIRLLSGLALASLFNLPYQSRDSSARKRHKSRPPCPPCISRKKGKCTRFLLDGTSCDNGGTCQAGLCVPPPFCAVHPDDTPCDSDGRCLKGICNPRPNCSGNTDRECKDCCSNGCIDAFVPGPGGGGGFIIVGCAPSGIGGRCLQSLDCAHPDFPDRKCVGYVCQ